MKSLVVQKYGGTSVGDVQKIMHVADKIIELRKNGKDVIVILSAMSGETNRLVGLAHSITPTPNQREMDRLLCTGEMVTIALLAICLENQGYPAISLTGRQMGILTDSSYTKAKIKEINSDVIQKYLDAGKVVVAAGFQGIDETGNVTTLGRGGSDTSAVAIAAAMKASICEIYTDVDGVYTADPRIIKEARRIDRISYEEMLELASLGAKVLHSRSVEFGLKYNVPILVKSTFKEGGGTLVTKEDSSMEDIVVSGLSCLKEQAKVKFIDVKDKPGIAATIFSSIADKNIVVDMIIQNVGSDGLTDLSFTIDAADVDSIKPTLQEISTSIDAEYSIDSNISKVSVVGAGMRSHSGIASKMFKELGKSGINIQMISTSEIKISIVVNKNDTDRAMQVLHDCFELGKS
ncbi:MAG: aspartate kinase [Nitrospinae bacterium]|nr:aspartate kinase [Nitrospinota bacterium]